MQALCGLQGIFDLFNCKTPEKQLIFLIFFKVSIYFIISSSLIIAGIHCIYSAVQV